MLKKEVRLYPHQQEAIDLVDENEGRALLAVHTGGGKTLSAIASMENLYAQGRARNVLIVVPASLKTNFINSIRKFSDGVNIKVYHGGSKSEILAAGDPNALSYTVVSQELFRKQPQKYMITRTGPIDSVVVDEIARSKNFDSKLSQALQLVSPQVTNYVGLSASPTSNTPAEIVPLMRAILNKDFAVANPGEFSKKYLENVRVKDESGNWITERRLKNLKGLKELFGDSVYYLGKEELAARYPRVEEETEKIQMGEKQVELYKFVMGTLDRKTRKKIEKGIPLSQREASHIFTKIQKARAVSVSTQGLLRDEAIEKTLEKSPKLRKIMEDVTEHITTTPDAQIMIYSNMVEGGVRAISSALAATGIKHGIFAGKGRFDQDRDKAVRDYKSGKTKVIVLSPAGKEGLSLDNTTMVAMAQNHYNPEVTSQAMARGIRIGGQSHRPPKERVVKVKKYISTLPPTLLNKLRITKPKRSVEEWVTSIAQRKAKSNKEFKQLLKQLGEGKAPKIRPIKAPENIQPTRVPRLGKPGLTFTVRKSKRKLRSDKGRTRGHYKARTNIPKESKVEITT
jgi:SNF2 family DNA or RNA helicase